LILWSDTAEEIWRPPSQKIVVLRDSAGLANLPVARVLEEFRRLPLEQTLLAAWHS